MRSFIRRSVDILRGLRTSLGLSLAELVAITGGLVALAGSVLLFGRVADDVTEHNGISSSDRAHLRWFIDHRPSALVHVARIVTDSGGVAVLSAIAVVAGLLLWRRGCRAVTAIAPGVALALAATFASTGKSVVGRARPPVGLRLVSVSDPSFPSGHATDSTALYVTLGLVLAVHVFRKPIARVLSVAGFGLFAGAIGTSRLVLGVHWPSDVLGGWALGAGVAFAVTIATTLIARALPPSTPVRASRLRSRAVHLLARERHPKPRRAVE